MTLPALCWLHIAAWNQDGRLQMRMAHNGWGARAGRRRRLAACWTRRLALFGEAAGKRKRQVVLSVATALVRT